MTNHGEQHHGEQVRDVHFSEDHLIVDLVDGRTVSAPLEKFPRLRQASPAQRINWTAAGGGFGIHWPDVDEDVSIGILLRKASEKNSTDEIAKLADLSEQNIDTSDIPEIADWSQADVGKFYPFDKTSPCGDPKSKDTQQRLVKMVSRLFEKWGLSAAEKSELLGAYTESRDQLKRISGLLSIHKSLHLLFPYNEDIRYDWVKRRHEMLDDQTPLELMAQQGLDGILRISRFLERQTTI